MRPIDNMWLFKRNSPDSDPDKSDEEIISHYAQNGDKKLFADLFKKHVTSVYGTCLFYLQNKDEAQDAVMYIFEKLMVDLKQNEIKNFKAWLSFVVRNHCISTIRKKNTVLKNTKNYYEFEYCETTYETELKLEKIKEDQLLEYMQQCLPQLKENQRKCVELFYLQNLSYQQISDSVGLAVNEVKSNIQNGKRNLKLLIEEKLRIKTNV